MLNNERFVDIVPWPTEFKNEDEALESYNGFGMWHKVQWKLQSITRNKETAVVDGFTIACARRGCVKKGESASDHTSGGGLSGGAILQLRDTGEVNCLVCIRFRWNKDRKRFRRVSRMIMHHAHDLEIKEG